VGCPSSRKASRWVWWSEARSIREAMLDRLWSPDLKVTFGEGAQRTPRSKERSEWLVGSVARSLPPAKADTAPF